ncbi:PREDICTED: plasmolipin-like [Branchiostoma belcheri]|uniref:Plasmolipin-like n=1 Tax=Branchiostoma belcheri TaxID=7741 RepID=A0A6P4ZGX6_BRABE|nr:PREDICTED: plasmolipin-like [Branchiostoma belcheri]
MADAEQQPQQSLVRRFLNFGYLKTPQGICKVAELVLGLCTWIIIVVHAYAGVQVYVMFVAVASWLITLLGLLLFMCGIHERVQFVPWQHTELGYNTGVTVLYLIAAILQVAFAGSSDAYKAAGAFAFFTTIVYGIAAFFSWRQWRGSRSGGGDQTVEKTPGAI